jgi:hypothetical protein
MDTMPGDNKVSEKRPSLSEVVNCPLVASWLISKLDRYAWQDSTGRVECYTSQSTGRNRLTVNATRQQNHCGQNHQGRKTV